MLCAEFSERFLLNEVPLGENKRSFTVSPFGSIVPNIQGSLHRSNQANRKQARQFDNFETVFEILHDYNEQASG